MTRLPYVKRAHWRPTAGGMLWHRWRTNGGGRAGANSSCGLTSPRIGTIDRSWVRPPAMARCARCDGAEITEHEADESLPERRRTRS